MNRKPLSASGFIDMSLPDFIFKLDFAPIMNKFLCFGAKTCRTMERSHAHHLIPKLGDDLRKVVECQFFIFHFIYGLWLETGCKGTQ